MDWHGVDIEASPEVSARSRTDAPFHTYDGVHLPFDSASFDVVYSHQVFEHVRRPEALLGEVTRVLRPRGAFIGSVSGLEPYHSFSLFNYTPYGWYILLDHAGLELVELRPGSTASRSSSASTEDGRPSSASFSTAGTSCSTPARCEATPALYR